MGCLHCGGLDSEKAQVFTRIVVPELDHMVTIMDRDLRMSMMFLITASTILEQMIRETIIMSPSEQINYEAYQLKIEKYKPTLEAMFEDFEDNVFGTHYNRRQRETFTEKLTQEGWKYFDVKNLNELFSLMLEEHGIDESLREKTEGEE